MEEAITDQIVKTTNQYFQAESTIEVPQDQIVSGLVCDNNEIVDIQTEQQQQPMMQQESPPKEIQPELRGSYGTDGT